MTKKEWLLERIADCVNWNDGCEFKFREVVYSDDLEEYYGIEPYDEERFSIPDDVYDTLTEEQKIPLREENNRREKEYWDKVDKARNKARSDMLELLWKLANEIRERQNG